MNFSIWNILKKRDPNDRFHRTEIASPISRLIWNDNTWAYTWTVNLDFFLPPSHPSIPHPSPNSKQNKKKVCLANLSDILVGSKNNLLHGLGRNLESFLESDAHHSSLVNKKKKTLYLLYFNWYSRLPITRNKRNKKDNSFPNITLSDCWLMLLSTSPTRQRPILKSGRNNNNNNNNNNKKQKWRASREESLFSLPTDEQTKRDF